MCILSAIWIFVLILRLCCHIYLIECVPFETSVSQYDQGINLYVSDCECTIDLDRTYTEDEWTMVITVNIHTEMIKIKPLEIVQSTETTYVAKSVGLSLGPGLVTVAFQLAHEVKVVPEGTCEGNTEQFFTVTEYFYTTTTMEESGGIQFEFRSDFDPGRSTTTDTVSSEVTTTEINFQMSLIDVSSFKEGLSTSKIVSDYTTEHETKTEKVHTLQSTEVITDTNDQPSSVNFEISSIMNKSNSNMDHTSSTKNSTFSTASNDIQPSSEISSKMSTEGPFPINSASISTKKTIYDTYQTKLAQATESTELENQTQTITVTKTENNSNVSNNLANCIEICRCSYSKNFTTMELQKKTQKLVSKIKIDKRTTLVARRKKISASDPRHTSTFIGFLSILFLSSIFGIVVLHDFEIFVIACKKHLRHQQETTISDMI